MSICISKFLLGTEKNLICDKDTGLYSWSSDVPNNTWFYGNAPRHERSLNDLCLLFHVNPRDKPPEKFVSAYTAVGKPAGIDVPWHMSLPRKAFQKFISDLVSDLWIALDSLDDTTYIEKFLNNRRTLGRLKPCKIDEKRLASLLRNQVNPTLSSTLKSFQPGKDGFVDPPLYQQGSTGRTVVKTGPKILTLKRDFRKIFKSRYPGGKVIQLDYTSLEPRIMLSLTGLEVPEDVYDHIGNKIGLELDRAKLKIAVMGALYGISAVRLQTMLSRTADASIVLDKIKRSFKINELANRLSREYEERGRIVNYYGRPLTFTKPDKHLFVSHYVQSTGVDICLEGFGKIIDYIDDNKLRVDPIYIIHDALLLDVAPEHANDIEAISKAGSSASGFDTFFPISISSPF